MSCVSLLTTHNLHIEIQAQNDTTLSLKNYNVFLCDQTTNVITFFRECNAVDGLCSNATY